MLKCHTATWPKVKFGDVVRKVSKKIDADTSGLERYVAGEHMDTDNLKISRWGTIGSGYLGPAFTSHFLPGQVLYGSRRTYLRKVAVPDFEGICANTTFVLESSSNELIAEFLPHVMSTESFHEFSISKSKGSVNPYINYSDLLGYEFELPPANEQYVIAHLLRQACAVEASLIGAVQQTWGTRNTILGNWLMGARPGSGDELGAVAHVNPTSTRLDKSSPFVTMDAVPILDRNPKYFEQKGSRSGARAMASDVLFARITPCLENGKTCQVPNDIESCGGSTELLVIRTKGLVPQDLIFHWATSQRIRHMAEGRMSGSTGRQRLSSQDLARLPFPDPASFDAEILVRKLNELEALGKLLAKKLDSAQSAN